MPNNQGVENVKSGRLKTLRISLGYTLNDLGRILEIDTSNLSKIETGKRALGKNLEFKILNLLPVNRDWWENGKGGPLEEASIIEEADGPIHESTNGSVFQDLGDGKILMTIPLVEYYAYGGYLSGWNDPHFVEELPKHSIIVEKHHRGTYRSFQVRGDSMDDDSNESICAGDVVTGRQVDKNLWGNRFHLHDWDDFVIVHQDGILVKRITSHSVEEGIITCTSLNPDKNSYPDLVLRLSEVHEIYNVIEVSRKRRK